MKPIYITGKYPHSQIIRGNPSDLLQAQSLGYLKMGGAGPSLVHVIEIHETDNGFQIEVDLG